MLFEDRVRIIFCRFACFSSFLLCAATMVAQVPVGGETPPTLPPTGTLPSADPTSVEITPQLIADRRQMVQANAAIDEAQRTKLLALYAQAEASLAQLDTIKEQAEQYAGMIESGKSAAENLQRQLDSSPFSDKITLPDEATAADLETLLSKIQAELDEAKKTHARCEAEQVRRNSRRTELPRSVAGLKSAISEQQNQLAILPTPAAADAPQLAQRTVIRAKIQQLEGQLATDEKETPAYDATVKQLDLQRELASRQVAALEKQLAAVRAEAQRRRDEETRRQVEAVRSEVAEQYPGLKHYVDNNLKLAEERQLRTEELQRTRAQLDESRARLEAFRREVENARAKVNAIGLNESTGLILRKQQADLPSPASLVADSDARQKTIRDVHLRILELQGRKSEVGTAETMADRIVQDMIISGTIVDGDEAKQAARQIAKQELDYIDALLSDYNSYFNDLVELDETRRAHAELVEQQSDFIDERILWIRSSPPLTAGDFSEAWEELSDMFSWKKISGVFDSLWGNIAEHRFFSGFAVLLIGLGIYFGRQLKKNLRAVGQSVLDSRMAPMRQTGKAILLTMAIAAIWPSFFGFIGWSIANAPNADAHSRAVGASILQMAILIVPLELLRNLLRPLGLGVAHFGWPQSVCHRGRNAVRMLLSLAAPVSYLIVLATNIQGPAQDSELARIAYIVVMLLIALAAWSLMGPKSPVVRWVRSNVTDVWITRVVPLAAVLLVAAPIVLAAAAALGYYYTAARLTSKLSLTVWLMIGLLVLSGAVLRWLVIARTRLARARAREQREQSSSGAISQDVAGDSIEELELDTTVVSVQSKQLLHLVMLVFMLGGLGLIWQDVMPALRKLDQIEIFPAAEQTAVAPVTPREEGDGSTENGNGSELLPGMVSVADESGGESGPSEGTSLADIALAFLAALLFWAVLRNLSGSLELVVLQRLPMDAGGRYAVATICRYSLIIVAVIVVAGFLGIRWSNVQWLVAAITVGLGFGLQEIFANFVSGIILLLERPMRIGDIVTVGEVSGVVSRIQIRATTITNWERQELVVPNKEFVTGRLLNWTLSNSINRIMIQVGIAYGSDTKVAERTLYRIIENHPIVLKDPPPVVTFEGFGDSTLNFTCRVYLPNVDHRLDTIHQLHMQIDEAFRAACIEIAFPQRDLHIRSIDGREARLPIVQDEGNIISEDK